MSSDAPPMPAQWVDESMSKPSPKARRATAPARSSRTWRTSSLTIDGSQSSTFFDDEKRRNESPIDDTCHGSHTDRENDHSQPPMSARSTRFGATAQAANIPAGQLPSERGAWAQISRDWDEHDEKMVKKWNEQIDTLLVFAGLFSAVVVDFSSDAYQRLQPDPGDETKAILAQISLQIANLPQALRAEAGISVPPFSAPKPFTPALSDVLINTLWFSSLVCALIAASLGILVKQWLQHYAAEDYAFPRERVRLRHHRFSGLCAWYVPEIVSFLPLLLRVALFLFLAGIIVAVATLHPAVTWSVALLVIIWLIAYLASIILPSIYPSCPYKSPEAAIFYVVSSIFRDGLRPTMDRTGYPSWRDHENAVKENGDMDPHVLAAADQTFADKSLASAIRECFRDLNTASAMQGLLLIIDQRVGLKSKALRAAAWVRRDLPSFSRVTRRGAESLVNIIADNFDKLSRGPLPLSSIPGWFSEAFGCLNFLLTTIDWTATETSFDKHLVQSMANLLRASSNESGTRQIIINPILSILSVHLTLCQKPLGEFLPDLIATVQENARNEAWSQSVNSCTTILTIASRMDSNLLNADESLAVYLEDYVKILNATALIGSTLVMPADRHIVLSYLDACYQASLDLDNVYSRRELCVGLRSALDVCRTSIKY